MTTLFFNGCSFVHGHSLLTEFPEAHNLSDKVGSITKLPTVNLGVYGASNDLIALSTIDYFEQLSSEERQSYVACIGWTEPSRLMAPDPFSVPSEEFSSTDNLSNMRKLWLNLNIHVFEHADKDIKDKFKSLVKEVIMQLGEPYWFKEHIKDIVMLQSYFEANKIPYIFWNSIGMPLLDAGKYTVDTYTNLVKWDNWINWNELNVRYMYPTVGNIPLEYNHPYDNKYGILAQLLTQNASNKLTWTATGHPGPTSVNAMATLIAKHITLKNLIKN